MIGTFILYVGTDALMLSCCYYAVTYVTDFRDSCIDLDATYVK